MPLLYKQQKYEFTFMSEHENEITRVVESFIREDNDIPYIEFVIRYN